MSLPVSNNYYAAASGTTDVYKTSAKFIPDIWSGKLAVKFYIATCLGEITNNDWEGEIRDVGDKVIIRSVPSITIRPYSKGQDLVFEVPASTPLELQVNKGQYWGVIVDDVDALQMDIRGSEMFTDDASEQMKIKIENDVFSTVFTNAASANKGNAAGAISNNIVLGTSGTPKSIDKTNVIDHIVDLNLVLDEQNVPETGRWVVVPSAMAARIKKSELRDASITGDNQSVMRNGRLGMIDRTTVYVSNNLSNSAGKFDIMAGTRDAISFAAQITKMESMRSQSKFGDLIRGLSVYGFEVTKPEALVHSVVTMG